MSTRLNLAWLCGALAVTLIILTPPAYAHFLGYSAVRNRGIVYQDKTRYDTEMTHAIRQWNGLGSIRLTADTLFTLEDLEWRDYSDCSSRYIGYYQYDRLFSDDIAFNVCRMNEVSPLWRRHTAGEELGHALGLDHSFCGQLVDPTCDGSTKVDTIQSHDESDYRALWN